MSVSGRPACQNRYCRPQNGPAAPNRLRGQRRTQAQAHVSQSDWVAPSPAHSAAQSCTRVPCCAALTPPAEGSCPAPAAVPRGTARSAPRSATPRSAGSDPCTIAQRRPVGGWSPQRVRTQDAPLAWRWVGAARFGGRAPTPAARRQAAAQQQGARNHLHTGPQAHLRY